MPITVAVAGSKETMSEYVARLSRAIASWSKTYGMTDDVTPTATPAASATGSTSAGAALQPAIGVTTTAATKDRRRQTVEAADTGAAREPVCEHDVDGEESRVRERERDPDRLALEPHVRQEIDARDGESERERVPRRSRAERRQGDHGQELDRGHGAEWQAVDGHVEADVHRGEDHRQSGYDVPGSAVRAGEGAPRPTPGREDQRRARDPKPGDAERLDSREQEHGERRPEVVKHRAPDEEGLRWDGRGETRDRADLRVAVHGCNLGSVRPATLSDMVPAGVR